jgi:hypothetical protein
VAVANPEFDTPNTEGHSQMKKIEQGSAVYNMAKVYEFLEIWQGSQILHATQTESPTQNKQMSAEGYISDTQETVKASWSLFQHDGATTFKLWKRFFSFATSVVYKEPSWRTN